jgi:hypothetical protein
MKSIYIKLLFLFVVNSYSQNQSKSLKELFINKLIEDKERYSMISKSDTIYIFGDGSNFKYKNTVVCFLHIKDAKQKIKKQNNLIFISMSDFEVLNNTTTSNFIFMKAIKNAKTDFSYFNDTNAFYCLQFNCDTKLNTVNWCGTKTFN